jgi:hypothetical protein
MKKSPLLLPYLLGGLALTVAAPAFAQTDAPPPAATNPPAAVVVSSPSGGGAGIGIGAVATLGGLAGGQFVYDQAMFHVEAILEYDHTSRAGMMPSTSDFEFGAGGWYHLFRGVNSDFSLGGVAGIFYTSTGGVSGTAFTLEPGAQARVFLTPNFALSGRVGFAITFGDNNADTVISLGGQTEAAFGFTYFIR